MKNNDYHQLILKNLPKSYQVWFAEEKKYLKKHISKNAHVLEIGSGEGRSVSDLIKITKNITAIDHDKEAIKKSKKQFSEFNTVIFLKAEAENLPFENEKFDFVITMASFMNFGDHKFKILNEMKRVLKNNGKIILSSFSEKSLIERIKLYQKINLPIKAVTDNKVIFDEEVGDNISEQFTKAELINIFKQVKLKVEDIKEVSIVYLCTLSKS